MVVKWDVHWAAKKAAARVVPRVSWRAAPRAGSKADRLDSLMAAWLAVPKVESLVGQMEPLSAV